MTAPPRALVDSRDGPFGDVVASRLRADGVEVIERMAALPLGATLDILVMDLVMASSDVRFHDVADDDLRLLLDRQLYALIAAVQAAVPRMAPTGAIVAIVPNAYLGAWGATHVAAVAAACVAMVRSMAIELAPRGIRVNAVAVGPIDPAAAAEDVSADVAATVAWLAGSDSGQVTGETILVDRGASLRMAQSARR